MVRRLRPLSALITIVVAVGFGGRLKRVDDASSMSRDIRLVGGFLVMIICESTPIGQWISHSAKPSKNTPKQMHRAGYTFSMATASAWPKSATVRVS